MTHCLDENIQSYLIWLKNVKKAPYHTFRAYQIDLLQFLKYFLRLEINDIPGKEQIEEYIYSIKEKYNYSTYRRKITALRGFIAYLTDCGIPAADPFISVSLPLPDVNFNLPVTYEDILLLINSMQENNEMETRDKLIFCLISKSGLTIKQLLKIKLKDINMASNQIILSTSQLTFFDNATKITLQKHINFLQTKGHLSLEDYLLCNNSKLPLSPRTINLIVDKTPKKLNYETRLSPTILRRLFAKNLNEKNINKTTKQLILGKKCRLAG